MTDLQKNTDDNSEDDMENRFLTFLINGGLFGIGLKNVMEIVGIQPITRMPEMPVYIKGIINLRGKMIPVMDVRLRFSEARKDYDDRTCIIVIDYGSISVGLIVDSVFEVLTIPKGDIAEKPKIGSRASRGYVNGIGKIGEKVVLLIDCEKLLNEEELDAVSAQL